LYCYRTILRRSTDPGFLLRLREIVAAVLTTAAALHSLASSETFSFLGNDSEYVGQREQKPTLQNLQYLWLLCNFFQISVWYLLVSLQYGEYDLQGTKQQDINKGSQVYSEIAAIPFSFLAAGCTE
jgi:hypothetical protein